MRLSRRDATALGAGGALLVGLSFWLLVYEPVQNRIELLQRKVQAKQSEYRDVQDLVQRLGRLTSNAGQVEERLRRGQGFSVLTYLEKVAVDLDLRKRITQMRGKGGETTRHYRENAIEVKMEKISMAELVKYLYLVEHPKADDASAALLRVKQLRV
ncbi:MAG: type II secretion system protein M, partial [Deltaproteobacteria bacterium]|nr:type II secretion system protein M [Deltaproteobacteria bacterium]